MMKRLFSLMVAALWTSGCVTSTRVPDPPSGVIVESGGGIAGYQHGVDRSLYSVGAHPHRTIEHGYAKLVGDAGTLAIDQFNGSVYGVPTRDALPQRQAPYGRTPADHDAFVRAYFIKCGVPAEQIGTLQGRTLLEVTGRSDEQERPSPKVTGYYTGLQRVVDGVPVADSFAWARVNVSGEIVEEAVYWPAISQNVVESLKRLREVIADPKRQHDFADRIQIKSSNARLAIHHSAASSHESFEAFASVDVLTKIMSPEVGLPTANDSSERASAQSQSGASYFRHFDSDGRQVFLPQERFHLDQKFGPRHMTTGQAGSAAGAARLKAE